MKTLLSFFTILFLLGFSTRLNAQVNITSGLSPTELAAYITGGGVKVLNATYNCPDKSQGKFKVVESNLGLDSGIVITNGRAGSAPGSPYYYPASWTGFDSIPVPDSFGVNGAGWAFDPFLAGWNAQGPSTVLSATDYNDYDVDTMLSQPGWPFVSHDACKLEFDFITTADSVRFDYVFGSMQYISNPCAAGGDVFAAFLSGPGITGKKNIATVPGTDYPISVATIQDPVAIHAYYTDLTGPGDSVSCYPTGPYPYFPEYYVYNYLGETIIYAGFSTVLTANASVNPCNTYHMKIVIADVETALGDSGAFIKAGSFSAPTSQLTASGSAGLHTTGAATDTAIAVAGCAPATFTFHTPSPQPTPTTYHVSYAGSAVAGIDYAALPASFVMPAGATSFSWPVSVLSGGAFSSTLIATVSDSTAFFCLGGLPELRSAVLLLIDSLPLAIATPDTALCLPGCISPLTNTFSADSQLSFFWTPVAGVANPFSKTTTICPPAADSAITYTLHAFLPGGNCDTSVASITILPVSRPVVTASVPGGAATTCLEAPLPLLVTATPDYQNYQYNWQPALYLDTNTTSNPSFLANGAAGSYTVSVTATPITAFGAVPACAASDSLTITVLPIGLNFLSKDTAICLGDSIVVKASGSSELAYVWTPEADTTISNPAVVNPTITPSVPGYVTYTLTASYPNCPDIIKSFTLETDPFPIEVRIPADTLVCKADRIPLKSKVEATGVFPYRYTWSGERPNGVPYPLGVDTTITFEALQSTRLWLTVSTPAGCYGSDTMTVSVQECCHLNVATAFTPNKDGRNDLLKVVSQSGAKVAYFKIYNRRGVMVYEQNGSEGGWDGTYKGVAQDMGVYMYVIKYRCAADSEEKIFKGDVTLVR